jgi:hypothetical protein
MKATTSSKPPNRAGGGVRITPGRISTDDNSRAKKSLERYLELARASERLGDHVATESLYQHAEHYNRLMTSARRPSEDQSLR